MIKIIQPVNFSVFQRNFDHAAEVPVIIAADSESKQLHYRFGMIGKFTPWTALPFQPFAGQVMAKATIPSGGWYQLELAIIDSKGRKQSAKTDKFGVGEVFVTAGQSNSANWGEIKQKTKTGMVATFNGTAWQLANDPMPVCGGTDGSIWPLVGDALAERLKAPVGFLCLGVGSSSVAHWDPASAWPQSPDAENLAGLYGRLIKKYLPLLNPYGYRAVLWHQGESDRDMERAEYYQAMKRLAMTFKRDFGPAPWMIAIVGNQWMDPEYGRGCRAAQRQIIAEGLAFEGPDTDTLGTEYRQQLDGSHFNAKGLNAHARLWVNCLEKRFFSASMKTNAPPGLSPMHQAAVNRRRRIVNQEDANEPVEALGMDIDKWIGHRFDLVDRNGCQIDTLLWDIGIAEDADTISKNQSLPHWDHPGLKRWQAAGTDWVKRLIEETHKRGLEAFWNHRIAEVDMPRRYGDCAFDAPERDNYLKTAHPDWVNKCWWPQGLWDLSSTGLREHKVKLLRELLERYDFDGLQLDFTRHTPCLPPGKEWENRGCATEFVGMVRRLLLEFEVLRRKPRLLAVKVAETIQGCHADGFEVEKWAADNLVDLIVIGGRTSEVDLAGFKKITAGKNIQICPSFDGHHANDGYYHPPLDYYRGVFSNWLEQGADSVGVFNWTCARAEKYDALGLPGAMKCPSQEQALFEVGSLETMKNKGRIYAVERRGGYPWAGNYLYRNDNKPLPFKVNAENARAELPIFIYHARGAAECSETLEIVMWRISVAEINEVRVNNCSLPLLSYDDAWSDPQIYCDKPQPTAGGMGCYPIAPEYNLLKTVYQLPPDGLSAGRNIVSVTFKAVSAGRHGTIEKIEARFTAE